MAVAHRLRFSASMTESAVRQSPLPWTCPFCPLLCDGFGVAVTGSALSLTGSDCPRAQAALARFDLKTAAAAEVDGQPSELDAAIAAAATLLRTSRQPLIAGLGTDVAGARALYRLACATGAISDAAGGDVLMQGLRVLQDRGGFSTTLAEVRERADLVVCVGSVPSARFPEFFARCGLFDAKPGAAPVIRLGEAADEPAWQAAAARLGSRASTVATGDDDLYTTAAWLASLVEGRAAAAAPAGLAALAAQLKAARYAVLVYEPARLPAQGALVIEMLNRVVATLNRKTRAAALALGGNDGAATANQVYAWLSGLPLRSRAGPSGLEHEPLAFGTARLVSDRAVDALLWISSFEGHAPPVAKLPAIVLGPPHAERAGAAVFIPVATPGLTSAGHLFRTDGTVLMPLHAAYADGLPSVADVVQRLTAALHTEGTP
jgi:formylmethanofuran dehydrogenase subunit B